MQLPLNVLAPPASGTAACSDDLGATAPPLPSLVDRLLALLECIGTAEQPLSLSQISRQTGLPVSTVHRLLAGLVGRNVVERHDRYYAPGPRMSWMVGQRTLAAAADLFKPSRSYLLAHVAATGLPAALAVADGLRVRYIEVASPHAHPAAVIYRMRVAPLLTTAAGKLMLAYSSQPAPISRSRTGGAPGSAVSAADTHLERELRRVRHEGIAFAWEESVPGVVDIAAPVRHNAGQVVAAVSTACCVGETRPAIAASYTKATAERLAAALGAIRSSAPAPGSGRRLDRS